MPDKYISAAAAALILDVTRGRVCQMVQEGKLRRVELPNVEDLRSCYLLSAEVLELRAQRAQGK